MECEIVLAAFLYQLKLLVKNNTGKPSQPTINRSIWLQTAPNNTQQTWALVTRGKSTLVHQSSGFPYKVLQITRSMNSHIKSHVNKSRKATVNTNCKLGLPVVYLP